MTKDKEAITRSAKKNRNKYVSTQRYLQLASVHDDVLVLKDGGIRAILDISALNFDLKSEEEQNALILSYQHFLNALNFPVQVLIRSRKIDIDRYLELLRGRINDQKNDLMKTQLEDHIDYIKRLVDYSDIMEKKFFLVVPFAPTAVIEPSFLSKFLKYISPDDTAIRAITRKKQFKGLKEKLETRVNVVSTGIANCGISLRRLKTKEIIELLYQSYNPDICKSQKLENANDLMVDGSPEDNLFEDQEMKLDVGYSD